MPGDGLVGYIFPELEPSHLLDNWQNHGMPYQCFNHPTEDIIDFFHRPVQIEVPTKSELLKEDRMAMTPEMDTARMERTMRVIEYEEDKPKIKRFLEEPLGDPEAEPAVPTDWDLSFGEYLEEHKNSKLLFCWYAPRVGIVFSPSDHNGIWAGRLEGVKGKGTLPEYVLKVVERIAKEKGLA
jgi:hypothetical protein